VRGVAGLVNQMREKSRQELISQGTGQAVLGQGSWIASGAEAQGEGASA